MVDKYVLKMGNYYLSQYWVDKDTIKTNFVNGILFTTNIDIAVKFTIEDLKELNKILYINTGVEFDIKKVEGKYE